MHLADLGARVIKVESPTRPDLLRFLEPHVNHQNVGFSLLNRGKESVVIAFETEAGSRLVADLAAGCDVVVESFRAGFLKRFNLDYTSLARPGLIYCSITAHGQGSSRAGHDLNSLALSGLTSLLYDPPEVPRLQLADLTTGMAACQAILAALFAREQTGEGRHLDISLTDTAYHLTCLASASVIAGTESYDGGLLEGSQPFYRHYQCADGKWLAVAGVEEKFRERLGERDYSSRTREEWLALLGPLDVCVEPVLTPEEVVASDWFQQRFGSRQQPPGLLEGSYARPPSQPTPPGQNTLQVLREFGLENLERLLEEGIIFPTEPGSGLDADRPTAP